MSIALTVLLLVELAAGVVLLLRWRAHRRRVEAFEARVAAVQPAQPGTGPAATTPPILVRIRNAQDLAARESWAARRFGPLVPRLVGREVAQRAAEQMAGQLAEQGVEADITVLATGQPVAAHVEDAVAAGTAGLREAHHTIAAVPFDLLDGVPPARAVRAVHDRTADGVYDTVGTVNRIAGHLLRRRER